MELVIKIKIKINTKFDLITNIFEFLFIKIWYLY